MQRLLIKVLNRLGLLRFLNLSFHRSFNGKRFIIPIQGKIGHDLLEEREAWMQKALKKIIQAKRNSSFVDVGVNLGQTLVTVKSIIPEIKYIGFEPNPTCVAYVLSLIRLNDFKNVQILPIGIGSTDGLTLLFHNAAKPEDSSGSIVEPFRDVSGMEQKTVLTFSSKNLLFLQDQPVGIIKIDVEGAELEVIANLQEVIRKDKPIIICEILPVYTSQNEFRLNRQKKLLQIISELDYHIYRIGLDGSFVKIDTIEVHDQLDECNYLFLHSGQIKLIE